MLATYPSLDFTQLWVSLAKTICDEDGAPFGVAAIDVDTGFLGETLTGEIFENIMDFFLITIPEELVLYGDRTKNIDGGKPDKLKTATEYLFGTDNYNEEEKQYFLDNVEPWF